MGIIGGMRSERIVGVLALGLLVSCGSEQAPKKQSAAPAKVEPAPAVYKVKLETSKGDIVVEVHKEWAPRAADRFWELVAARYYDEARFYRVVRNFIAQFGIHRNAEQNRLWHELKIPDDPVKQKNRKGTLSFAHNGPNTRSTQVFINLKDNPILDTANFAPFARVVEGMDVAEKLYFAYGEIAPRGGGPDGAKAEAEGNAYLEPRYPRLDYIKTARVIP